MPKPAEPSPWWRPDKHQDRRPFLVARARGDELTLEGPSADRHGGTGRPLDRLRKILEAYRAEPMADQPPFTCGAVGYFGFDTARWVERLPATDR